MRTASQTSVGQTASDVQAPTGEILLRRSARLESKVRLATLSWSIPSMDFPNLTAGEFLTALGQVHERNGQPFDLLLVAGRTIDSEPKIEEILSRTGGCPVLLEVQNEDDSMRWLLAYRDTEARAALLRQRQLLFRRSGSDDEYNGVSDAIAAGQGVIRFADMDLRLILLICGENNALRDHGVGSALWSSAPGLEQFAGGNWIALNPAHRPYWPQSKMSGFTKVGRVGNAGPILRRVSERNESEPDGTRPPLAIVHCNNFFAERQRTEAFASVVFQGGKRIEPIRTAEGGVRSEDGEEMIRWMLSVYELAVPAAS